MEKSIFDKIQYMLEAHYPILYLTTFEYDRTRQKVYGILRNLKGEVNVHEWDCVNPYVGWGHKLLPNEKYSARTMTKWDADELLRKDLRKFVAMFRKFGVDSTLLGTLAYNVGPAKLLGSKTLPQSTLIKKLEAGDRNIYREYIAFCNYKGKRHAMLLKRRKAEFALLYIP